MNLIDLMIAPSAVESRRSGHRVGRQLGETLRGRYLALLVSHPDGLTDHQSAALLGCLSTTVGSRRQEINAAAGRPVVESAGRVQHMGWASRTRWRLAQ